MKKRSTGPSRVVPHRSTTPARTSLTSLFGWEAVSLVDMAALILPFRSLFMNKLRHQRHIRFQWPVRAYVACRHGGKCSLTSYRCYVCLELM